MSNPFLALPTNRAAKPGVHRSGYGLALRDVAFGSSHGFTSWEDGLGVLASAVMPAPRCLVPIALADEQSLACVVIGALDDGGAGGNVVRWHLGAVPVGEQGRLLDVDPFLYLKSLAEELAARESGYRLMTDKIFPDYNAEVLVRGA